MGRSKIRNKKEALEAVKKLGLTLKYVPAKFKTAELCLKAVKQHGAALRYVPKKLKTAELCMEAMEQNDWALLYMPDKYQMLEWRLRAEKSLARIVELCFKAVEGNGWSLEFVPSELNKAELCLGYLRTMRRHGRLHKYMLDEFKEVELCLEAVKNLFEEESVLWIKQKNTYQLSV